MTELLVSIFIRDKDQVNSVVVRKKYGFLASMVGILCNIVLFTLKFILGILSGSVAITADAFNNLSDTGSSLVTFLGFKFAAKPADKEHPYGHGRYEYLSGFIIAVLILLIGFEFLKESIIKIFNPAPITFNQFVVVGLVASILIKLWLCFFYRKLGIRLSSTTLIASATDSLSDVFTTTVTLVGIVSAAQFNLPLDGYLGVFVALMVLYAGYKVSRDTLSPLLGRAPDPELINQIRHKVLSFSGILDVHDIIVHDYGPGRMLASLHADVPANEQLGDVHELVDRIEKELREELRVDAVIHIDPRDTECKLTAELYDKVAQLAKSCDERFGIHDFRVKGECIVFDLTVPIEDRRKNAEIESQLLNMAEEMIPGYKIEIIIDRI